MPTATKGSGSWMQRTEKEVFSLEEMVRSLNCQASDDRHEANLLNAL